MIILLGIIVRFSSEVVIQVSIMLALSPPLFSTSGWPLEDQMSHENWTVNDPFMDSNYRQPETLESSYGFPSYHQPVIHELNEPRPSGSIIGDPSTDKKFNHNASERDRRKKLNGLYSTLRSLLPRTDQMKKLSIPATVSHVLKYIPELQKQVRRLIQRKEEILSSFSRQGELTSLPKQRKGDIGQSLPTVSASRVDDREVVIQISTFKFKRSRLSQVLLNLEGEDLQILNASVFASFGDRVFYNLHLQVNGTQKMECEVLSEKLLSLCEGEELFP